MFKVSRQYFINIGLFRLDRVEKQNAYQYFIVIKLAMSLFNHSLNYSDISEKPDEKAVKFSRLFLVYFIVLEEAVDRL